MKMFLVNLRSPLRNILELDMKLTIGNKGKGWAWAIDKDGKRHLIGSSAFHTRTAAEKVQTAMVIKLLKDDYVLHHYPYVHNRCKSFLQKNNITLH